MISRSVRSAVAKVSVASAFAAAALAGIAPSAFADTSTTTNGCYAWYGATSADGHCTDPYVTQSGQYQVYGVCAYESDSMSRWVTFSRGSRADQWGKIDCTFNMRQAWINYS